MIRAALALAAFLLGALLSRAKATARKHGPTIVEIPISAADIEAAATVSSFLGTEIAASLHVHEHPNRWRMRRPTMEA